MKWFSLLLVALVTVTVVTRISRASDPAARLSPASPLQSSSWHRLAAPADWRGDYFTDIDLTSADEGWAVGTLATAHYIDAAWHTVTTPYSRTLSAIDMVSPSDGWAVGDRGTILRYQNGEWSLASSPTTKYLRAIAMVSPTDGWSLGEDGVILHYTGGSWQSTISPTKNWLEAVDMISPTDGWAVGSNAAILHYVNGTWQIVEEHLGWGSLTDVDMVSPTDGWAVGDGGIIIHYDGSSWREMASPTDEQLLTIAMVTSTYGWAGGAGLLRYEDGTWQDTAIPDNCSDDGLVASITMLSADEGWAVGSCNMILHYFSESLQLRDGVSATHSRSFLPYLLSRR